MQHLFFIPTISNFQSISKNGRVVLTEDRRLISNDTINPSTFLGVKPCIEYLTASQVKQKDVFLVEHEKAYILAKELYREICNVKVSWNYFSATDTIGWAMFLVSNYTSLSDIVTEEATTIFSDSGSLNMDTLKKFDLIIGVQNSYDGEDEPTFYAVIRHKDYEKGCYLTIASYKFSFQTKLEYIKNNGEINILIDDIKKQASKLFKKELNEFKKLYSSLHNIHWTTINDDFTSVCLDILNHNRSVESIKNDKGLRNEINFTQESSAMFLNMGINKNRKEFAMLLDYVIYNNHFDLHSFQSNRSKTEQIFVQKRSYKTIYTRILNVVENKLRVYDYLKEQNETYNKIFPYLQK